MKKLMNVSLLVLYLLFAMLPTLAFTNDIRVAQARSNICSECSIELINDDDSLLFLSTLDGTFLGVNVRNGRIAWQFKEEAAVKVPASPKNALMPIFLPDPKDGSLYMLNSENHSDLKKLQFTIQQLVSSSPCRSADGKFYTGRKIDNWFMVDWRTGAKEELFGSENPEKICPLMNRHSMFVGRTEYNLIISDVKRRERKWNVTFYDYAAKIIAPKKMKNHENRYFSGSSTGRFVALKNSGDGSFLWESDFGSPVIGVYLREGDGLISLPFTTMDDSSMHLLNLELNKRVKLFSTLYIGEHSHGLYALPAIATTGSTLLLLNGPSLEQTATTSIANAAETSALLGYYQMPEHEIEPLQIDGPSDATIEMNTTKNHPSDVFVQERGEAGDSDLMLDPSFLHQLIYSSGDYILSSHNMEMKIFMLTVLIMMVFMFIYFRAQVHEFKKSSSSGFVQLTSSNIGAVTAFAEELSDGSIRVGKILFDPNQILGKGCEGTFVFKGKFDNRQVAVKRLLPECFTFADREVCLLRESDQHPNVIRYFCMEQDKQFRYIALELCSATLQEYTEKGVLRDFITPMEALSQAVSGLEHLHSLQIVHRDIKPHNVLLSSFKENQVRAMISDFGLCKKLQTGKVSFSGKSGITGTDGWIAPEIIHGNGRTTAAVDIFSMGCVFYYVLSRGKHPFGDSLHRQANIMNRIYKLNELTDDPYDLWTHLITKMVDFYPMRRPCINVIKNHPAFWKNDQILMFLQDVSDRIEKEETSSRVLIELETGNSFVLCGGDWRDVIEREIADDLRKYRTYRADSVRDLLRALRNKKHHYRELTDRVREIFGSIPDKFVKYWMDRFPKLMLHTWLAMQCVSSEDVFQKYYCNSYTFDRIHDGGIPSWIQQAVSSSPRWRVPGRPSVPKFGLNSRNGPFASLYSNVRMHEYNWRQRRKTIDEVDFPNDECNVEETSNFLQNCDTARAASSLQIAAEEIYDVSTCARETENLFEFDQENVEPVTGISGEMISDENEGKKIKHIRHRRTRNRPKKKSSDASVKPSESKCVSVDDDFENMRHRLS